MMVRLNTQFFHGFGARPDMTDFGRKLHADVCRALDMTAMSVVLQKAVDAGRIHPRKAELYHAQCGALLAQITSDLALNDPGFKSMGDDPVNRLRGALSDLTKFRPESEHDYASIGGQAIEMAHRMLASVPPAKEG